MAAIKKSKFVLGALIASLALTVSSISMSIAWYIGGTQLRVDGDGLIVEIDGGGELEICPTPIGEYVDHLTDQEIGGEAPSSVEGVILKNKTENAYTYSIEFADGSKKTFVDTITTELDEEEKEVEKHTYTSADNVEVSIGELGTWIFDGQDSGISGTGRILIPKKFDAVSTMFQSEWLSDEKIDPVPSFFTYPSLFCPPSGIPYGPKDSLNGFYSRALYLRAQDNAYVSLDPTECYLNEDEALNRQTAKELYEQNEALIHQDEEQYGFTNRLHYTEAEYLERLNALKKSMRVSIYDVENREYYIFDPHKDGDTVYGGILDNNRDGYFDTYTTANGETYETIYGELNDRSLVSYGPRLEEDDPINLDGELTCFHAKHLKGSFPYDAAASKQNGLTFKKEETLTFNDASSENPADNPFVLELDRYVPKKIVLSIYMEGWDLDCINSTMGASFIAQLQFRIIRRMAK